MTAFRKVHTFPQYCLKMTYINLFYLFDYPPVIKHFNGKSHIYRWCFHSNFLHRGFPMAIFDSQTTSQWADILKSFGGLAPPTQEANDVLRWHTILKMEGCKVACFDAIRTTERCVLSGPFLCRPTCRKHLEHVCDLQHWLKLSYPENPTSYQMIIIISHYDGHHMGVNKTSSLDTNWKKTRQVCHLASYLAAPMSTWRIFTAANAWTWNLHAWCGCTPGTQKLMKMKIRMRRGGQKSKLSCFPMIFPIPYSTTHPLRLYLGWLLRDILWHFAHLSHWFFSKDALNPVEIIRNYFARWTKMPWPWSSCAPMWSRSQMRREPWWDASVAPKRRSRRSFWKVRRRFFSVLVLLKNMGTHGYPKKHQKTRVNHHFCWWIFPIQWI